MKKKRVLKLPEQTIQSLRRDLATLEGADTHRRLFLDQWKATQSEQSADDVATRVLFSAANIITERNLRTIYAFSESAIERLLLASLSIGFCFSDPFGIRFRPPDPDIRTTIIATRRRNIVLSAHITAYETAKAKAQEYLHLRDWIAAEGLTAEMHEIEDFYLGQCFDFNSVWQMTMQAGFPGINNGKSCRVDLLAWRPDEDDSNGLIVECDGYEFHSDKEHFTADRQRDRLFRSIGFDVIRYSGSEIHANPVQAALDLCEVLLRIDRSRSKRG